MSVRDVITTTSVRSLLAIFVVVFGLVSITVFTMKTDITVGIFGLINFVLGYYFAASKTTPTPQTENRNND